MFSGWVCISYKLQLICLFTPGVGDFMTGSLLSFAASKLETSKISKLLNLHLHCTRILVRVSIQQISFPMTFDYSVQR